MRQKARTTKEKMDKLVISTLKLVPMKTPHEENEDSKKKKKNTNPTKLKTQTTGWEQIFAKQGSNRDHTN